MGPRAGRAALQDLVNKPAESDSPAPVGRARRAGYPAAGSTVGAAEKVFASLGAVRS